MFEQLKNTIRSGLAVILVDLGVKRTFLVDFELAAINAVREVFPEPDAVVKGCTFHFRQAIIRHVAKEGLSTAYNAGDGSNDVIRRWIRQILAMPLLPGFAVPLAWEFLKLPPLTSIPDIDLKAQALSAYVEKTWIAGDFAPSMWSHFDNLGPRTTNLAEGWHNSLNSSFGMPHPSMRNFLHWLQQCQFSVQCRGLQLAAGRTPKRRSPVYDKLDEDIFAAKRRYSMNIGHIYAYVFPDQHDSIAFRDETLSYLSHVSNFFVGGDKC